MSVCTDSGQPICGNGLVEAGEECDCGYSDQCNDPCCYNANEAEGKRCKLQPGKICRSDEMSMIFFISFCHSAASLVCCPTFDGFMTLSFYSTVPAKGHVALNSACLRAQVRGADPSQTVPKRASAMEQLRCV